MRRKGLFVILMNCSEVLDGKSHLFAELEKVLIVLSCNLLRLFLSINAVVNEPTIYIDLNRYQPTHSVDHVQPSGIHMASR